MNQLTAKYLSGDPSATSEIYRNLQPKLLLTAYFYCRSKETARDIVHDVFEKLIRLPLEKRAEYFDSSDGNIEAWLYVAVRHKAMDHRKISVNREKIDLSIRFVSKSDTVNNAFERISKADLLRMLEHLQPRQKEILNLHISGYKNEEIAEKLDLTYNTVKNNIYEARQRLRKLWTVFME
jgi:RNA polymerase sigma-70 factor (ECF subfamily)